MALPEALVEELDELCTHYPERRAALIPALHRCQEELGGWITPEMIGDCAAYFDLEPVVRALADESGMDARIETCHRGTDSGVAFYSDWMLLSRDSCALDAVCGPEESSERHRVVHWTDDCNNLLNVLR